MNSSVFEGPPNGPDVYPFAASTEPDAPPVAVETIIRPGHHPNDEISFLWNPGIRLVELVHQPGVGLRFAVKDAAEDRVSYESNVDTFQPLRWLAPYAAINNIKLPSAVERYGTLNELAGRISDFIHRYLDASPIFESVAVLYVLHTWIYDRFQAVPYLRFMGLSGSGKTRATETIGSLCYRPLVIAGAATPAPMYRQIAAVGGTVLLDEADFRSSQIGTDIIKVLNCGYSPWIIKPSG